MDYPKIGFGQTDRRVIVKRVRTGELSLTIAGSGQEIQPPMDDSRPNPVPASQLGTGMYDFGLGPVPAHRHANGGGWVADTVDLDPEAFVEEGSLVFGNVRMRGPVRIEGRSRVHGNAWVWGSVRIQGGSSVCEHAMVSEAAKIRGGSVAKGRTWVTGNACLDGASVAKDDSLIAQDARVDEGSEVGGRAQVYGAARVRAAAVGGDERVYGNEIRTGPCASGWRG